LFALPTAFYTGLEAIVHRLGQHVSFSGLSKLVWSPGALTAWAGAVLCVLAIVLGVWSFRIVRARLSAHDYAGGLLGLGAATAVAVILTGGAAMPAYDRQRSYRPVAELAADELARGRRIALAASEQQIVGEFVFYTGRPIPVVEAVPGTRAFLDAGDGPAGVVVRNSQLEEIEASLQGLDHAVRRLPTNAGYNANEFCLITSR
jgi:hypothetical protein